jgi:hypothetical protein
LIKKSFGRALLVVLLCAALATPAPARDLQAQADNIVVGVVVAVAAVVAVTIVAIYYSKKRTITGCVTPGANGMTVTDEKDRQIYALSGNIEGVTPAARMRLRGRKIKSKGPNKTLVWETGSVEKDFGACRP